MSAFEMVLNDRRVILKEPYQAPIDDERICIGRPDNIVRMALPYAGRRLTAAQTAIDENQKRFAHRMPEKWKRFGL